MQGVAKKQEGEFSTLDKGAISLLMQHLPAKDAVALGSTCKKTRAVLESMWHFFLLRDFGYKAKDPFQVYKEEYACKDIPRTIRDLCDVVDYGDLTAVQCLLRADINPSAQDNYAIGVAAQNGHLDVVELLLADKRVNPSADNNYAIRWAAHWGHLDVVQLLLKDKRVIEALPLGELAEYTELVK